MIYDHKTWDICLSNHVGSDIPTVDGSKKTRLDLIYPLVVEHSAQGISLEMEVLLGKSSKYHLVI
jgi:hypothetical protein